MSGLEVLGATVAVTQLAGYVIRIIEALLQLRDHIKHAPARFQSYLEQLQSLAFTIRSIQDSQDFFAIVEESPLRAISQKVDALNLLLSDSIRRVSRPTTARYIRIFAEKKTEKRIKEGFAALEGLRGNLSLCIVESSRRSVENLRADLQACMLNTERKDTTEREPSISSQTEVTLNEMNPLTPPSTPKEVVPMPTQSRATSVDSNVTMTDNPETAKESQPHEPETTKATQSDNPDTGMRNGPAGNKPYFIIDGVESTKNAIGGVGYGMTHGEIRNSKATANTFGGIGPMGPEFLQLMLQANLHLLRTA